MDMIVDFSASPAVAIPTRLTYERVAMPSPVAFPAGLCCTAR
jgi:hypothetical protein